MTKDIAPEHFAPNLFNPSDISKRECDIWGIDIFANSEAERYEATFSEVLAKIGVKDFPQLFESRKSQGLSNHILDLMGGGYFIEPKKYYLVDSMTGFRLGNPEKAYKEIILEDIASEKEPDHLNKLEEQLDRLSQLQSLATRQVVYGSVYDLAAWDKLDRNQSFRHINSFDVAVCRPVFPFYESTITNGNKITDYQKLQYGAVFDRVFDQLEQRMNHHNGIVFAQVPGIVKHEWLTRWVDKASHKYGVTIDLGVNLNRGVGNTGSVLMARY